MAARSGRPPGVGDALGLPDHLLRLRHDLAAVQSVPLPQRWTAERGMPGEAASQLTTFTFQLPEAPVSTPRRCHTRSQTAGPDTAAGHIGERT